MVVLSLVLILVISASIGAFAKSEVKDSLTVELLFRQLPVFKIACWIEKEFELQNPSIKLTFNFACLRDLQKQIEQGAPTDLFISAGAKQMKALVDGDYVDSASQTPLLANDLVMVMPMDSKIKLAKETNKELTKPEIKVVAIGIPESVPAGMYTKQTLNYLGIYEELTPKLVQAKDVRQVLTYVETGNADAGFVYRTDAITSKKVKIMLTVAAKAHDAILYPEGIVKETKHITEATSFYKYLQGKEATAIFMKYGFKLPSKP